ncbi:MAG: cysteine hydrolase family protein [Gemmatimonadota bacterium]
MARIALLVVDVQEAAVALGPYQGEVVLANIAALVDACRSNDVEVVHVQHDGDPGEDTEPGTEGWRIHAPVAPAPGEKVVRKRYNSAFRGTSLRSYLDARGIDTLILVGLQTEYCVDTTCRVAFEHGYRVVMPEMTNSTYDNGELTAEEVHELFNRRIFEGRFAAVPSLESALREISAGGA